ncbi:WhiB family transcriptional regulator [Catellatospora sichuanensis]|uniref:WhiB family transcriptional regulator n=1 Tax=Catellatospora sichuanensis TaxID=1969805 RepID=UPI001183F0A7
MSYICAKNPDLWFSEVQEEIELAKDGCLDCPLSVYTACRERGWEEEHGVFGGLSSADRRKLNPKRTNSLVRRNVAEASTVDKTLKSAKVTRALDLLSKGLNSTEVAATVGVPPATVRWWLMRHQAVN